MKAAQKTKKKYMSNEAFADLELSLNQALDYERGKRDGYRVTERPIPPAPKPISSARIVALRHRLNCSQSMFARLLNVSTKTVQSWEQGVRTPSDAALKLLAVASTHPEALWDTE